MKFSEIFQELKSSLQFIDYQRSIDEAIESYWTYPLQDNEFIYIVGIPQEQILFHKGFEKLGLPKVAGDIPLDPDLAYRYIFEEDFDAVAHITKDILSAEKILDFCHKMLHVEYRAHKTDGTLIKLHRDCKIIAYDSISGDPVAYYSSFRLYEKSADLTSGVKFELFPSGENAATFQEALEQSFHLWKYSNTAFSKRELEVYNLFSKGISKSKEIAKRLGIKRSTVEVFFKNAKQHALKEDPELQNRIDILLHMKSKGYFDVLKTLDKLKVR